MVTSRSAGPPGAWEPDGGGDSPGLLYLPAGLYLQYYRCHRPGKTSDSTHKCTPHMPATTFTREKIDLGPYTGERRLVDLYIASMIPHYMQVETEPSSIVTYI